MHEFFIGLSHKFQIHEAYMYCIKTSFPEFYIVLYHQFNIILTCFNTWYATFKDVEKQYALLQQ